jgi:hypothetical protein
MRIYRGTDEVRLGMTVSVVMNGGCHCWAGARHQERTHVKLRGEASGGGVSDSIRGDLYCVTSELAFWWCSRVSLLITQGKQQRAWSAPGWVPATHYIINKVSLNFAALIQQTPQQLVLHINIHLWVNFLSPPSHLGYSFMISFVLCCSFSFLCFSTTYHTINES